MHDKFILALKDEILNILTGMLDIRKEMNYYEISLPMLLDNSHQVNMFLQELQKNEYILYNNLYIPLEMSLKEDLKGKKIGRISEKYLKNPKEFKEIKDTLEQFGINTNKITLEYKIKNLEKLHEEVLEYGEFIKRYYNIVYNILLEKYTKKPERKRVYYKNFVKVLNTYSGKNKFDELNYEGLSGSPVYQNKNSLITSSRDFPTLTKFYIDLEDLASNINYKKGILIYKATQKRESLKSLELKFNKKNFKIVFTGSDTENEIKKIIDNEFFNEEK